MLGRAVHSATGKSAHTHTHVMLRYARYPGNAWRNAPGNRHSRGERQTDRDRQSTLTLLLSLPT